MGKHSRIPTFIIIIALIIFITMVISSLNRKPRNSQAANPQVAASSDSKCGYGHEVYNQDKTFWNARRSQPITGTFDYSVWNRWGGKTSINIMIVGIINENGELVGKTKQVFGPDIPGECREGAKRGTAKFELYTPTKTGTYKLIAISGPAYSLADLQDKYVTGREKVPTQIIGTVNVVN